jgi:glucose uptake protein
MYIPATYGTALILMLTSMVCWGSWPNLLKRLPAWRLEYFYFDFTVGLLVTAVLYGMTLGSGETGASGFIATLWHAGPREAWFAVVGGFIWNFGNILLLNSIMLVGLAVAFPIAAIPAIVLGIGASYWLNPVGNAVALVTSAVLLLIAAQTTAAAYGRLGSVVTAHRSKGIAVALISGFLIGFFPPFVTAAFSGSAGLDAYALTTFFTVGAFLATLVSLPVLLKKPLVGEAGKLAGYFGGSTGQHVLGLLAGAIWCTGTVFNFISASLVGVAISVGIGSGAPMVGALWGVFVWGEFASGDRKAKRLIGAALVLYAVGVATMAIAYTLQ